MGSPTEVRIVIPPAERFFPALVIICRSIVWQLAFETIRKEDEQGKVNTFISDGFALIKVTIIPSFYNTHLRCNLLRVHLHHI